MSKIKLSKEFIRSTVKLALNEDLYPSGDITSSLIENNKVVTVKLLSNQNAIIGGLLFAKQAFELIDSKIKFIPKKKDGFKVNEKVYSIVEGDNPTTMAKSTGLAIIELSNIFENTKPDMVLTVADRFETLATAVAASYMNIPLVHTQGGEVTGSIDESVRHAITRLANIHFPATIKSKKKMGYMK